MKLLKSSICTFLCCFLMLSLCSCGMFLVSDSEEQNAYNDTLKSLFNAIDNKDEDAIYNLFSPEVRKKDKNLKEQIKKLITVYSGPTDEIGYDGLLAGEAVYENGETYKDAETSFPIRSGDTYYWCYIKIVYKSTADESKIGITQLDFSTADEACIAYYDDEYVREEDIGLTIYAEQTIQDNIRCIDGKPHKYIETDKELNVDDVKEFLKSSKNFKDFQNKFGKPNFENIFCYYSLPKQNGKNQYLEIGFNDYDFTIYGVHIVDDFKYIETVFEDLDVK